MPTFLPTALRAAPVLALVGLGCSGEVGAPRTAERGDDEPARPPVANPPGVMMPAGPPSVCAQIGPAPLRRLTRSEYNETVKELLGDASRPGNALPPDSVKDGFDNNADGQSTKALHASAFIQAAEGMATRAKLDALVPCPPAGADDGCAKAFIEGFGKRAFRRPLTPDEATAYFEFYKAQKAAGTEAALRLTLQAFLTAPQFVYRAEVGPVAAGKPSALTAYETASRLSYFLLGSMPDAPLFEAADKGALSTKDELVAQVDRLLKDPRARSRMRELFAQWLTTAEMDDLQRDAKLFPGWSTSIPGLMRTEVETFAEKVFFDENGAYAALVSASHTYANPALAKFYGLTAASGTGFEKVSRDENRHAGVLTMGGILAMSSKEERSSPIFRGRWVREQLLCQHLPPPPPGLEIKPPPFTPTTTTRQAHEAHANDPTCRSCHQLIDPIGHLFEAFDAVGKPRANEKGLTIDTAGEVLDGGDLTGKYANAFELGRKMASSEAGASCAVKMMFRFAQGRSETAEDKCALNAIAAAFRGSGGNLRQLVVAIVQSDAFRYRMGGN